MNASDKALLFGLAIAAGLRVLDWLLPKGRHFTWVERFSRPDVSDPLPPLPEDEKG